MPIRKIGDFYVNIEDGKKQLGIDSNNISGCIKEYKSGKYDGVFGNNGYGFKEDNFDFLHELSDVKKIWFWDVDLKNVEGIYSLKSLEHFGVHGKRKGINFAMLENLTEISTDWISKDENMDSCIHIENFYLWHHKPKEKSFEKYRFPNCSNEVHLNWSNVSDFTTLNGLKGMKKLEIHRSRNLISLKGIENYQDTLEEVFVDTCGNLSEYNFLRDFLKLKLAVVNGDVLRNETD
ncbi:hypothetical protein [Alkalihalobacillus deserti]|uniref:hypothetical protein n=1 Tax=Alkalihalobacillus deserti TaxID=2879466 RepID=UPI001D144C9B|nr:hypothetical protein [Alkalihalobacillus deserti]